MGGWCGVDAKGFDAFQASVQRVIESKPELKQYAEQIRADYTAENSPARASLLNADGTVNTAALEEDVCLKTFERLIQDPERLTQAVAYDRTAIESFLDVVRGIKNSLVIKFTGSEKAMLDEAERTLTNLLRGEAGTVESERFSYVGENANLNNAERAKLALAKRMEQNGQIAYDIRRITNWFRSMDGEWRMEVDDSVAQYFSDGDAQGTVSGIRTTVRDYFVHPELERLEPRLFDLPMRRSSALGVERNGAYLGAGEGIILSPDAGKSTALHELQHGIQDLQELAGGSNINNGKEWALINAYKAAKGEPLYQALETPNERYNYIQNKATEIAGVDTFEEAAYEYYRRAAGEVEARDTANRAAYGSAERRIISPDIRGDARYASDPNILYVDMLLEMGYSKEEISKILEE